MKVNEYLRKSMVHTLVVSFLLFVGIPSSYAENDNKGFYVGAGVGQADHKDNCEEVFGSSCDEEDLGWKVFAGYKFNKHFAVEGGSVDFGHADADIPFINVNTLEIVVATLETKVDGFFLSSIVEWPIGDKFSVLTKLGVIYWDIEFKGSDLPGAGELIGDEDENGTDYFFGLGAQYKITENFFLRAEWERFNNIGESKIDLSTDIDLISGGIVLQF